MVGIWCWSCVGASMGVSEGTRVGIDVADAAELVSSTAQAWALEMIPEWAAVW